MTLLVIVGSTSNIMTNNDKQSTDDKHKADRNTPDRDNSEHKTPINKFTKYFKRPLINQAVRETTSGGVIVRKSLTDGKLQVLLVQDAKDRWTIPKGHIEEGETPRQTAEREIIEETGLKEMEIRDHLGKVDFRYRRQNTLVLMTMHVFLVKALGDTNKLQKEDWMNGIQWFNFYEALDKIEYEGIEKLMLLGLKKLRQRGI